MTDPAVRHLQEHHEGWVPDQPLPAVPALMTGGPAPAGSPAAGSEPVKNHDVTQDHDKLWATFSYVAAIVSWLVAPLAVYLTRGRRSAFVRQHAAQAFSFTLTVTLFAISGAIIAGLLALDSPRDALYLMGPVLVAFGLVVLWYLVRAARAAGRGEFYPLPAWLCIPTLR